MNFLDPRPGTPFADLPVIEPRDALPAIAAFRLAMPRTVLRFAGGRELTLGDLGTRQGVFGGINAMIVGNYLTTLGCDPREDLDLLAELSMPVRELSKTLWPSSRRLTAMGAACRPARVTTRGAGRDAQ